MEEFILELNGKLLELDKEKAKNPMMDLSQRRLSILRDFIETFGENPLQILQENASLKAKIVKITEEHKSEMSLLAKTMNHIVKMHEKTQEAFDEKTNELANIKQELQSVNLTNQELLQKFQESKIVKNEPSELRKTLTPVNQNKTKTEVKVEIKEEPLKDLHMVHDNSKQIAKLTEGEENGKLKEERYFEEVHGEMGIDFVTSKTFDNEYLKSTKTIPKKCPKSKLNQKEHSSAAAIAYNLDKNKESSSESTESTELCNSRKRKTSSQPDAEFLQEPKIAKKDPKTCPTCGKTFTRPVDCERHISSVHEKNKPYQCDHCKVCFTNKSALNRHMQSVHMGEKPFMCKFCPRGFVQKGRWTTHESKCRPVQMSRKSDSN